MKPALLLVDVQNDFFPGGALATPEGDQIIEPVNRLIDMANERKLPVFATRDWHPEGHCSFEKQGGPWPPHCIRGTEGAAFHPDIRLPDRTAVITKAETQEKDAYSGFDETDLAERLRENEVDTVIVAGLATDVCVKNTVLDALMEDFNTIVVNEAIRGVDAEPGDRDRAVEEMKDRGAKFMSVDDLAPQS